MIAESAWTGLLVTALLLARSTTTKRVELSSAVSQTVINLSDSIEHEPNLMHDWGIPSWASWKRKLRTPNNKYFECKLTHHNDSEIAWRFIHTFNSSEKIIGICGCAIWTTTGKRNPLYTNKLGPSRFRKTINSSERANNKNWLRYHHCTPS